MIEKIFIFFVCLFAAAIGAISGIGGGVIIKPILDATTSLTAHQISFLSGCTVFSMAIVSFITGSKKNKDIDWKSCRYLAVGAAIGGVFGKELFNFIQHTSGNDRIVVLVQNIAMTLLMLGVIIYISRKSMVQTLNVTSSAACVFIGTMLGLVSSFLGIGGGPINLIALYYFFSMDAKKAAYVSIFIILLSQGASITFSIMTRSMPVVNVHLLILMIIGGATGGFLGRRISIIISDKQTERLFFFIAVMIVGTSVWNVVRIV